MCFKKILGWLKGNKSSSSYNFCVLHGEFYGVNGKSEMADGVLKFVLEPQGYCGKVVGYKQQFSILLLETDNAEASAQFRIALYNNCNIETFKVKGTEIDCG